MNLFFIMHDPNIISRFIQSAVDNTAEQNGLTYQIQKKLNLNCGPHKCCCMQIENSVLSSVQTVMSSTTILESKIGDKRNRGTN